MQARENKQSRGSDVSAQTMRAANKSPWTDELNPSWSKSRPLSLRMRFQKRTNTTTIMMKLARRIENRSLFQLLFTTPAYVALKRFLVRLCLRGRELLSSRLIKI